MNYEIKPSWDTDLAIVSKLGTIDPDSALNGLVCDAVKITAGTPTAVAGKYIPGAIVRNAASGIVYRNSGSTASPAWSTM